MRMTQRVLHDWSDSECIRILEKCREAIGRDDDNSRTSSSDGKQGMKKIKKVIILEAVIDDDDEQQEEEEEVWKGVKLSLDMAMMAHTGGGKERTRSEWARVLTEAGLSCFNIKPTSNVQSVMECLP